MPVDLGFWVFIFTNLILHLGQDIPNNFTINLSNMQKMRPAEDMIVVVLQVVIFRQAHQVAVLDF